MNLFAKKAYPNDILCVVYLMNFKQSTNKHLLWWREEQEY